MLKIALLNMKGGCGKTTMATNLAAFYAHRGLKTALTDYDSQGSSIHWLSKRSSKLPKIYSLDGSKSKQKKVIMSWEIQPPVDTEISILDTPAGVGTMDLNLLVDRSDIIIIPVMPSSIDTHAAAHFIEALLIKARAKQKGKKIGIIANRVLFNTKAYISLEKFLAYLDIPLVASFRGVQNYVYAGEQGIGIHELPKGRTKKDIEQWDKLTDWIAASTKH